MPYYETMTYDGLSAYQFEELPKGELFSLSMNPYNGLVLAYFEKHRSSSFIALDIMRQIVNVCDVLEDAGSVDPLRDYVELSEKGQLVKKLSEAARAKIKPIKGGGDYEGLPGIGESVVKAS